MKLLEISNLSKCYKNYGSELKRITNWFFPVFKSQEEFWILQDISFKITAGESIGLIGVNGAGKSTLLKLITGTLQPTSGSIKRTGKIAAILELGMGFNLNLTGRQNAIHAAGLMGYSFQEIQEVIQNIETFSEIGEYFDQPVRVYSSGMQMRVAFAVATAFRPDVLIIDEALSVGDAYFQHKSFKKIQEYQEQGTTLILVSHDKSLILSVCNRVILLNNGRIEKDGSPSDVLELYNALIVKDQNSTVKLSSHGDNASLISGTGEATVQEVIVENSNHQKVNVLNVGESITIKIKIKVFKDIDDLVVGFLIKNKFGQSVFGTNTWQTSQVLQGLKSGDSLEFNVSMSANLGVDNYSITTALSGGNTHVDRNYEWRELACVFSVVNMFKNDFVGISWMDVNTSFMDKKNG